MNKCRVTIFILILAILSYFSIGYTYETFCTNLDNLKVDVEDIEDNSINIDGSDFTLIFRFIGYGVNSFFELVIYAIFTIIIFIVSIVLIVPFKLIVFRKNTIFTPLEIKITKLSFVGVVFLSILISCIITKFTIIIPLLFYTMIWATIVFFVYVLPVLNVNIKNQ